MKIGFIGLGIMGRPMAKNLLKAGYDVTVDSHSPAAAAELEACGAKVADQPTIGSTCDLVLTMLPNAPQVKQVMLGANGVAAHMQPGSTFIDMTSLNPIASREIAAELAARGIQMLDAPVSGGEPKAIDGTLSFMVGGEEEVFNTFKPVLLAMGSSAVRCGGIGAGNTTKLANQIIVAANIQAVAEALTLAQKAGVDPDLVFQAIKCGASDTTSGMASNCVIGYVADKLVDLGATVIFGETTEFLGGEHLLARRAVNKEVADKIYEIVTNMENRAKSIGCDMRKGQPTPGNIAGGLSSIEEKSLGAIVKSGTRPIQGVLEYPQHVTDQKGLWIKDTPGREPEILTGMAATGAQFMMFSTGRGAPQGFPSMPVIKICGNPNTYQRMENDMDLNAGLIITGDKTIEQVGEEAFAKLLRVLSGEMTKNEAIQYFSAIDIHCLGPVI